MIVTEDSLNNLIDFNMVWINLEPKVRRNFNLLLCILRQDLLRALESCLTYAIPCTV